MNRYALPASLFAALLAVVVQPAAAGTINFNADQGYAVGQLAGQQGWGGSPGTSHVVIDAGGGEQALSTVGAPIGFDNVAFTTNDAFLGGATMSTSVFSYRLEVSADAVVGSPAAREGHEITIARDTSGTQGRAIRMWVRGDGTVELLRPGGPRQRLLAADGVSEFDFDDVSGSVTIEGTIDLGSQTHTMSIGGVAQTDSGPSDFDFDFVQPGQDEFGIFQFGIRRTTEAADRPIVVDNLSAALIPEPASVGLALVAVSFAVRRRR